MKAMLAGIIALTLSVGLPMAVQAGPKPISAATAKANKANSLTQARCIAVCKSMSGDSCATNCRAGQCYYNDNTGNYYCVR